MYINKTGSDIMPFKHLFLDGKGELFQRAFSDSFSFASDTVKLIQEKAPDHKFNLWDQAVQYKLAKINKLKQLFVNGARALPSKKATVKKFINMDKNSGYCLTLLFN